MKTNEQASSTYDEMLDALENLWKSCILEDQTVVGRIHLDQAAIVIEKAKKSRAI